MNGNKNAELAPLGRALLVEPIEADEPVHGSTEMRERRNRGYKLGEATVGRGRGTAGVPQHSTRAESKPAVRGPATTDRAVAA